MRPALFTNVLHPYPLVSGGPRRELCCCSRCMSMRYNMTVQSRLVSISLYTSLILVGPSVELNCHDCQGYMRQNEAEWGYRTSLYSFLPFFLLVSASLGERLNFQTHQSSNKAVEVAYLLLPHGDSWTHWENYTLTCRQHGGVSWCCVFATPFFRKAEQIAKPPFDLFAVNQHSNIIWVLLVGPVQCLVNEHIWNQHLLT